MKSIEQYKIDKALYKPMPDFSCLTATKEDIDRQYESLKDKLKSLHKDFIPDIDLEHINLENTNDLDESKGDILPNDVFVEQIRKKYLFSDGQIKKVEYYNGIGVYVAIHSDDSIIRLLDIDMRDHGYFLSYSTSNGYVSMLFFEPLKQANISSLVFKQKYIYHYTQKSRVDKIMNDGLEPRRERKTYIYPKRVYFSLYENDKLASNLMKSLQDEGMYPDRTYSLLRVKTENLDKDIKFYYDVFAQNCVFTSSFIGKECIEKVKDIKII